MPVYWGVLMDDSENKKKRLDVVLKNIASLLLFSTAQHRYIYNIKIFRERISLATNTHIHIH